ncbi:hypothetical protein [Sphingomonas edaphi]|uniref:Uncharacterized protein n=1 Tax=Sphingomonas edaphi TaxID=2315689 RepID=A0A418Q1Y2_9SPHN|nr:hypothetical protein [Sphingomonas edaphi]RIX31844.1 hypothetical protein D3M59_02275 [Sphingomonas edaphi]
MLPVLDLAPDGHIDPIPPVCARLQRLMLATATIHEGDVVTSPEQRYPELRNTFLMPIAGTIIAATKCDRPLGTREVQGVASVLNQDAIVIRPNEKALATFDVILRGAARPFCGYRLWVAQPSGCAWLVPTAGEMAFIRFDPLGLEVTCLPPYDSQTQRQRGLRHGREFLNVAMQGWF